MTDRPILFSAPMVRALLAGRKTQTRRILKPQPEWTPAGLWHIRGSGGVCFANRVEDVPAAAADYVPQQPGDRLWVREAGLQLGNAVDEGRDRVGYEACGFRYAADCATTYRPGMFEGHDYERRRVSIHMPRWASRITLAVIEVRVKRLQDISEADAEAEGVVWESADPPFWYVPYIHPHSITGVGIEEPGGRHAVRSYAKLWDYINGPGAWDANPWVAAITFTAERRNIDALQETA